MGERLTREQIAELNGLERFMYSKFRVKPAELELTAMFVIVALGVVGWLAYRGGELIRVALGGRPDDEYVVRQWEPDAPILIDIDQDGREEIVGLYAGDAPGGIYLGAFGGPKGLLVWRHGPLHVERVRGGGLSHIGVQAGRIVLLQMNKPMKVLKLASGELVGELSLPTAAGTATPRLVCGSAEPDGPLRIATTSADVSFELDLTRLELERLEPGRPPCERTVTRARTTNAANLALDSKVQWAIRDAEDVVALSLPSSGAVLHGFAHDARKPRWNVPVLPQAPGQAAPPSLEHVALTNGRLYLAYRNKVDRDLWALALDARQGKEIWRVALTAPAQSPLSSLSASPTRVALVHGPYLVLLDARGGKYERVYGSAEE